MQFELASVTYDSYMEKLQERKGVVEERIMGEKIRSPVCSFAYSSGL